MQLIDVLSASFASKHEINDLMQNMCQKFD